MSKERLSKLQKWILEKCLKDINISRDKAREFYGKRFSPKGRYKWARFSIRKEQERFFDNNKGTGRIQEYKPKKEFMTTRAVEATISRTFRNLVGKGYLVRGRFAYELTRKGWLKVNRNENSLKVNRNQNTETVSFKDYRQRLDELTKKQIGWARQIRYFAEMENLPKKRSMEDRKFKAARQKTKLSQN